MEILLVIFWILVIIVSCGGIMYIWRYLKNMFFKTIILNFVLGEIESFDVVLFLEENEEAISDVIKLKLQDEATKEAIKAFFEKILETL